MAPLKAEAIVQAVGTIGAAIVIAVGAWTTAQSFQPKFVRWGDNLANIEHLILVGEQDDGSGCSVILSTTLVREFETPEGPRTGLSGHSVDDDVECETIRRAVQDYTIDARSETDRN